MRNHWTSECLYNPKGKRKGKRSQSGEVAPQTNGDHPEGPPPSPEEFAAFAPKAANDPEEVPSENALELEFGCFDCETQANLFQVPGQEDGGTEVFDSRRMMIRKRRESRIAWVAHGTISHTCMCTRAQGTRHVRIVNLRPVVWTPM